MENPLLPFHLDKQEISFIKSGLLPDENLLWCGKPRQGIVFRLSDFIFIPFSILWGGTAFYIAGLIAGSDADWQGKLQVYFFAVVGLFLIIGRFLWDKWRRTRISYAVTERRIIIISRIFHRSIFSLNIKSLSEITLEENINKSGTIYFGKKISEWINVEDNPQLAEEQKNMPRFELIPSVKIIYDLILKIRDHSVQPPTVIELTKQ